MKIAKKETIQRWLLLWVVGNLLVALFLFPVLVLGLSGVAGIRIRGFRWSKISHRSHPEGVVGYYSHVSLADGLVLALRHWPRWLFGKQFLPLAFIADYWLERFPFLKQACIPLPKDEKTKGARREAAREALDVITRAEELLNQGRMLYMAPAGSRAKNCRSYKIRLDGKTIPRQINMFFTYDMLRALCENRLIATFQSGGIGRLATRTHAKFLPISIKRGAEWRRWFLEIAYGEIIEIAPEMRKDRKEAVAFLEDDLLAVAEKP